MLTTVRFIKDLVDIASRKEKVARSDGGGGEGVEGEFGALCCCCCFLTLTDPLRIQPWSQDRRNQTKSNRESEMSMESRQKRTDKK